MHLRRLRAVPHDTSVLGVLALTLAPLPAWAQSDPPAPQVETSRDRLDDIVVTARKTNENAQSVPLSVNVVTGEALQNKGATQLSNLTGTVSNLIWVDAGGGTFSNKVTLRGIYSNATSQGFDPGVAIYFDDVYIANQFGFNSALLDIDRVEVLKGPQGTLFGRNAAAGAISVHTTSPSTSSFSAVASGTYGSQNRKDARLLINLPLSDRVAFKFSSIYRDRDGYQRNSVTGRRDLNDEHFYGGRAQLLVSASDRVNFLATFEYFRNKDHQDIFSCVAAAGALPCPNATVAGLTDDVAADNGSSSARRTWAASLKVGWKIADGIDLTSITAYRDLTAFQDQDQDYSSVDFLRAGYNVPKDSQFSQELRLATDQTKRFRAVGGLYYFHEDRTTEIPFTLTKTALASLGILIPDDVLQVTHSELGTDSYAVFAQGQFDVLPKVTLEAGARYTRDAKRFVYAQTESSNLSAVPVPIQQAIYLVPFARSSGDASFGKVTYTASLSWKPTERVLVYGRYATGFKAGGFQAATNSPNYNPIIPFGPENSGSVEIGVKTETADRRLRFNVAAFSTVYNDTQVQISDATTFQKIVGNFGKAHAQGVEFELAARPVNGLSIDASLGLQRSTFVEGPFKGRKFQYVPDRTMSATVGYEHKLGRALSGFLSGTVTSRTAMNLNTDSPGAPGSEFQQSPGATVFNARIGIEGRDDRWAIYLWGNNLSNVRRITDFRGQGPVQPPAYHLTEPRTYGLELKVRL
ncbi:MAG: TonB-dependent receptor [Sphingomonadales bacterium]